MNHNPFLHLVLFLFIIFAAQLPAVVSHQAGNGRTLLQIKKPCPVNIENLNYTIITSQCKGPNYPPEPCCSGLKELACPIASDLNDPTNDCAEQLFSYIPTIGKYPTGLFSSVCKGSERGLECQSPTPPTPTLTTTTIANAAPPIRIFPPIFIGLLLFPLHFFVQKFGL
ncbi:GPI-anchored protein LLG1-like [Salvia hispanica]|uniref:GPI-anchored protein LLG1-like n=1 Tax=Salvia hispanica TaxID=49212 RepID=UPI002008F97D|nr:GPI-anchored protein LLG1-like [Salvia hispanica]